MKREEHIVRNYLISSGFGVPIYEPDGSRPPDFVLDSGVAVEVRRLNQNRLESKKVRGLEQEQFSLNLVIDGVLTEFDTDEPGDCYWVALTYRRPIGSLKNIRKQTRNAIRQFLVDPGSTPSRIQLTDKVRIELLEAGRKNRERFRIGMESDQDSGGWVVPLYVENIRICLREKEEKIGPYLSCYPEWWLILVDALLGMVPREWDKVVESLPKSRVFSRVIVIHDSGRILFEI